MSTSTEQVMRLLTRCLEVAAESTPNAPQVQAAARRASADPEFLDALVKILEAEQTTPPQHGSSSTYAHLGDYDDGIDMVLRLIASTGCSTEQAHALQAKVTEAAGPDLSVRIYLAGLVTAAIYVERSSLGTAQARRLRSQPSAGDILAVRDACTRLAADWTAAAKPVADEDLRKAATGSDLPPETQRARTPADFTAALPEFRVWADEPSFQEVARHARPHVEIMTGHYPGQKEPGASDPLMPWPRRSFLGTLTSGEREALLALGTERVYPRGTSIFRQGEEGAIVVLILDGIAKISIVAETSKEILVGIRGAGELIGEMAPLSGEPRSASAVAATRVHGTVIRAGLFLGYLGRSPGVATRLAQMVADRLRVANRRRLEFNSYPVEGRIARVLSEVALAHGHPDGSTWRIGPEITQADLASLSSVSVRTVEKVLRVFEQDGLVVRRRRGLVVVDPATLVAKAEYF